MGRRFALVFTLLAVCTASLVATWSGPVSAASIGNWTKLGNATATWAQPGLSVDFTTIDVDAVWVRKSAVDPTHFDLVHTTIPGDAAIGSTTTVVANEDTIDFKPALVIASLARAECGDDNYLRAAYGGTLNDVFGLYTVQADDVANPKDHGSAWLAPQTISPDAGTVAATVLRGCRPFFAVSGGQGLDVITDQGVQSPGSYEDPLGTCCAYYPNLAATLPADHNVPQTLWLGWYSITSDPNMNGLYVQEVDQSTGQPVGIPARMPGTVTNYHGVPSGYFDQVRVPMVSRPRYMEDGDVYVLYTGGYPTPTKLLLWRIGDQSSTVLATNKKGIYGPAISSSLYGQLWVSWISGGRVYTRLSTEDLSYWTPPYWVGFPDLPGTEPVRAWNLTVNGEFPPRLDIIGNFSAGGPSSFYARKIWIFIGTPDSDMMGGGAISASYPEFYLGRGGDDVINGKGGNDILLGGAGDDTLNGGDGKDELQGGAGDDVLHGGPDVDLLRGGSGTDTCWVTPGDTTSGCEHVKNE